MTKSIKSKSLFNLGMIRIRCDYNLNTGYLGIYSLLCKASPEYCKNNIMRKKLYLDNYLYVQLNYNKKIDTFCIFTRIAKISGIKHRKIMKHLKINGCAICGYNKYDGALDFHHTNPKDKKFCITLTNILHEPEKLADEINKCILLCSNCHREIHGGERYHMV